MCRGVGGRLAPARRPRKDGAIDVPIEILRGVLLRRGCRQSLYSSCVPCSAARRFQQSGSPTILGQAKSEYDAKGEACSEDDDEDILIYRVDSGTHHRGRGSELGRMPQRNGDQQHSFLLLLAEDLSAHHALV